MKKLILLGLGTFLLALSGSVLFDFIGQVFVGIIGSLLVSYAAYLPNKTGE